MNFVKIVLTAAAAAVLAVYIAKVEAPRMESEGQPERLLVLDAHAVESLVLRYPDGRILEVARDGSNWKMLRPVESRADNVQIQRLLTAIQDLELERRLTAQERQDLAVYGLEGDGERVRIDMHNADGSQLPAIIVGNTTPVGFSAFARLGDSEEVVVTPLLFHTGVNKTAFDLRYKKLFDSLNLRDVLSLEIDQGGQRVRIERRDQAWVLVEPIHEGADFDKTNGLLRSLLNIEALGFYDAELVDREEAGLDEPTATLTLDMGGGRSMGFSLGSGITEGAPGNYLERAWDGQVAKVPDWVASKLAMSLDEFRDKTLLPCPTEEVAALTIRRYGTEPFTLTRARPGRLAHRP